MSTGKTKKFKSTSCHQYKTQAGNGLGLGRSSISRSMGIGTGVMKHHRLSGPFGQSSMGMDTPNVINPCYSAGRGTSTNCYENIPKSACTVCQKECNSYTSSCDALESMYVKNFCTGLELYVGGPLTEMTLPFCNSCRDKVVYFSHAVQSYQQAKTIFESIRNDLAFTAIDSSRQQSGNSGNFGPQAIVRDNIINRWTDEYETKIAELFPYRQ